MAVAITKVGCAQAHLTSFLVGFDAELRRHPKAALAQVVVCARSAIRFLSPRGKFQIVARRRSANLKGPRRKETNRVEQAGPIQAVRAVYKSWGCKHP